MQCKDGCGDGTQPGRNYWLKAKHLSEGWLADWLLVMFHIVSVCALYSPNSVIQTRHVSEGWLADWSLVMFHVVSICALDSPNSVIQTRGEKKIIWGKLALGVGMALIPSLRTVELKAD